MIIDTNKINVRNVKIADEWLHNPKITLIFFYLNNFSINNRRI